MPSDGDVSFSDWIGSSESFEDQVSLPRVRALAAMLGQDPQHIPEFLPPLWHWGFAYEPVTPGLVGDDGHPLRGGFLPPVSLRRRMRAGGRVEILGELAIGAGIRRVSTVTTVDEKVGRTGPLAFVTVEHRIQVEGQEVIHEEERMVYTDSTPSPMSDPSETTPSPPGSWQQTLKTDPVLAFVFSALTGNAHRIHYDERYATEVEGYGGLVVQGPLIALLLAELAREHGAIAKVFEYRAIHPFLVGETIHLAGRRQASAVSLLAADNDGRPRFQAWLTSV